MGIIRMSLLFLLCAVSFSTLKAESRELAKTGIVSGVIIDKASKEPIEYASIALFKDSDNSLVDGTVTNVAGEFTLRKLPFGTYTLKMTFIGYSDLTQQGISISNEKPKNNLGNIYLDPSTESIDEVEIVANAKRVEYKIDKKVINVSKNLTAATGTAVDALENIPSVRVDIDGNVSLRGSTGFTVLIDGRPSILDASDALQQIPASSIQNIELITNPSAKYDPEGTAGIINIILKKNKLQGMSGIVNLNGGSFNKYGGDALLNWRKKNLNLFVGINGSNGDGPGKTETRRESSSDEGKTILSSTGDTERNFSRFGLKGGVEYSFTDNDVVSVEMNYGHFNMESGSELIYSEENIVNDISTMNQYNSSELTTRENKYFGGSANYTHSFSNIKGHQITATAMRFHRNGEDLSVNELFGLDNVVTEGRRTTEEGPGNFARAKIDYTLPLSETNRFEAGAQYQWSKSEDQSGMDTLNFDSYVTDDRFSRTTNYIKKVYSLYSLYAGETSGLGYQLGGRAEYTDREVSSKGEDSAVLDRWDFFPTVHLSYQIAEDNQLMMSYTRRIQRIRGHYLEPFVTWEDAYNVSQGNPDLMPEYINSMELGYLLNLNQTSYISLEGFYRITENKIEKVSSIWEEDADVIIETPENVGKDYSLGAEVMFSFDTWKWWHVDLMSDFYDYRIEGMLNGESLSQHSFNWGVRFNNTIKLNKTMQIQVNNSYNGPTATAQGETEGYYVMNIAAKKSFFDRKLSLTFQVNDVFESNIKETTTTGTDFSSYSKSWRKAPQFSMSLNYRINNYKVKRGQKGGGMSEDY